MKEILREGKWLTEGIKKLVFRLMISAVEGWKEESGKEKEEGRWRKVVK